MKINQKESTHPAPKCKRILVPILTLVHFLMSGVSHSEGKEACRDARVQNEDELTPKGGNSPPIPRDDMDPRKFRQKRDINHRFGPSQPVC